MIRIGAINIDTSHPSAFAKILNQENRARYVAVFNDSFRSDDEVAAFIEANGLEKRCRSVDELAEMSDIAFIHDCNWDTHLTHAEPFLKRGKPVFIDKPIVGNMRDIKKLLELHNEGKVLLGSSSMRYAKEIGAFFEKPAEERGAFISAWGSCGVDEFNYGIHIVEALCELAQAAPVAGEFVGRSTAEGKVCESFRIDFKGGATALYTVFHGTWLPCDVSMITTKGLSSFRIGSGDIYKALLDRICDYMETGKNAFACPQELANSIMAMLAGRISRENGGGTIKISDIPESDPGFDGWAFAKGYAAAAKKK